MNLFLVNRSIITTNIYTAAIIIITNAGDQKKGPRSRILEPRLVRNMRKDVLKHQMVFWSIILNSFLSCCASGLFWSTGTPPATDPEINMTADQIARRWGYPVESHKVTTRDGYILTIFRIPHGKNNASAANGKRPVVLFQHGLIASCASFLTNLPEQSGAYRYADAGLDVWVGNLRGTPYSRKHVNLSDGSPQIFDFGCDEFVEHDVPSTIDYILNNTGSKSLYYIGHSMGSTSALCLLSIDQSYQDKIRRFYALAPVTDGRSVQVTTRIMFTMVSAVQAAASKIGIGLPSLLSPVKRNLLELPCTSRIVGRVCTDLLFNFVGDDTGQLNMTRLPVFLAHAWGASWRTFVQLSQLIDSDMPRKFDYGVSENKRRYGQSTPPVYNISRIETPVAVYSADKDHLSTPENIRVIVAQLPNVIADVRLKNYNHADMLWGLNSHRDIYAPILRDITNDFGKYN